MKKDIFMENSFNKNDKQAYFNEIKGIIFELIPQEIFCGMTLKVGHENVRDVHFSVHRNLFEPLIKEFKIGDKVCASFYLKSHSKNGRWYTSAILLGATLELKG